MKTMLIRSIKTKVVGLKLKMDRRRKVGKALLFKLQSSQCSRQQDQAAVAI